MFEGYLHRFPLRVYFEDTDAAGIVYYANYLHFTERARTEMMREIGMASSETMANEGVALAVRHCKVEYLRPARLDDELTVETTVKKVGGASVKLYQAVVRDGEELVAMDLKLGCMSINGGRVARMPHALRKRLVEHIEG